VVWQVDDTVLNKEISPMLLMPFVENVFKHGIDKMNPRNEVKILLHQKEDEMVYRVTNTLCDEVKTAGGSGLPNLEKRLNLLYGERYVLRAGKENGCYIAELIIPA
jgi:LytS/YehU family sensor histidine kinase